MEQGKFIELREKFANELKRQLLKAAFRERDFLELQGNKKHKVGFHFETSESEQPGGKEYIIKLVVLVETSTAGAGDQGLQPEDKTV